MPRIEKRDVLIYSREEYDKAAENMGFTSAIMKIQKLIPAFANYNYDGTETDYNLFCTYIALNKAIEALEGARDNAI